MSIQKSVAVFGPGMGSGFLYQTLGTVTNGTAQATINVPSSGSFAVSVQTGRGRVKVYNGAGTSPTFVDLVVQAKDGTNTVTIGSSILHPNSAIALSATAWFEYVFDFLLDAGLASGNGGSAGTLITQGATSFAFLLTAGGTNPVYTADCEVYGE